MEISTEKVVRKKGSPDREIVYQKKRIQNQKKITTRTRKRHRSSACRLGNRLSKEIEVYTCNDHNPPKKRYRCFIQNDSLSYMTKGTFGRIYQSKHQNESVIKRIQFGGMKVSWHSRVLMEVAVPIFLKDCFTQHVIQAREILKPSNQNYSEDYKLFNSVYIVFEKMDRNLLELIHKRRDIQNRDQVRSIVYQILCGVEEMRLLGIYHLDIKPSNIMVNITTTYREQKGKKTENKKFEIKLIDFGLCCSTSYPHDLKKNWGLLVSMFYRAPELVEYDSRIQLNDYLKTADLWSVGCIFHEIITGQVMFPFLAESDMKIAFKKFSKYKGERMERLRQSYNCDDAMVDLISRMLEMDPTKRITVTEALNHPYFDSIKNEEKFNYSLFQKFNQDRKFKLDLLNYKSISEIRKVVYNMILKQESPCD